MNLQPHTPTTVLAEDDLPSPEMTEPACAACGSTEHVRCDTEDGVCFCADCWRQSEPPGPYEDIGGSG